MGLFSCFSRPKADVPQATPASHVIEKSNALAEGPIGATDPAGPLCDAFPVSKGLLVEALDGTGTDVLSALVDQTPRKLKGSAGGKGTPSRDQAEGGRDVTDGGAPVDVVKNLTEAVQGPVDFAPLLRTFTVEQTDAPVVTYLTGLGKCGVGLKDAVLVNPSVGRIFGEAYNLHLLAAQAMANRSPYLWNNAAKLDGAAQDVLRALDLAGCRGQMPSDPVLESLAHGLQGASRLLEPLAREGWLLHMVCNEKVKANFDGRHNELVEALESAGLEVPGKAAPLPRGDYHNPKAPRRTLKTIGGGSVAQGLQKLMGCDEHHPSVAELALQLGVEPQELVRELGALPADVPADVYYARMVAAEEGSGSSTPEHRYNAMYSWYDKSGDGLDHEAMRSVLNDLGLLEGLTPAEADARTNDAFATADRDGDGRISYAEFAKYCETLTCSNARQQLRLRLGLQKEDELRQIFVSFCSFGKGQATVEEMDSGAFAKVFKDCGLLGKDISMQDIDLAFARAKPKGGRRLTFDAFLTALSECAARMQASGRTSNAGGGSAAGSARTSNSGNAAGGPWTLESLVMAVLSCQGPVARATRADNVRLHDDKSTYTGVYAKGGPKVAQKPNDLAALLDRSDAAHQGPTSSRKPPAPRPGTSMRTTQIVAAEPTPPRTSNPSGGGYNMAQRLSVGGDAGVMRGIAWQRRSTGGGSTGQQQSLGGSGPLYDMWAMWAQFGLGAAAAHAGARVEMGESQFIKLLRECALLDKEGPGAAFTSRHADLVYARVKAKGAAKLSFDDFQRALALVAEGRKSSMADVVAAIINSGGPTITTHTPSRAH